MSKILETVLNNQLKCYLEDNGLMSPVQHAYRRSRSCSTAWMELDMRIRDAQNRFKHSVLVCTDQSAAFNLVTWPIILAKLEILGMDELSRRLVKSYLTGRMTQCKVGKAVSDEVTLESRIGEGSVLGLMCFISTQVDVSVLAERTVTKIRLEGMELEVYIIVYAGDVSALLVGDSEAVLQRGVDIISTEFLDYFSAAGLKKARMQDGIGDFPDPVNPESHRKKF